MRPESRLLTLAALAGTITMLTVPASAQNAAEGQLPQVAPLRFEAAVLGDAERRKASTRPRPNPGPFNPLVGRADYGTAENGFGAARSGHVHAGQDVFAPAGTPLVAVDDSVVAEVGSDGGRGNFIALRDRKRGRTYVYFHMNAPAEAKRGESVKAGTRVGEVGCTGSCWGDHLHFEVRNGGDAYGAAVNPLAMLKDWKSLERPR
jgi:murein DD-endopeptidase MepM/ murein hydrolase activator NlpD